MVYKKLNKMALTVKTLKEALVGYSDETEITNEHLQDIIHIRTRGKGLILSSSSPVGYCNRTGEKVYPSRIEGYEAFCPELNEDLYREEYTDMEKFQLVFQDGDTYYFDTLEEVKDAVKEEKSTFTVFEFDKVIKKYLMIAFSK